MLVPRQISADCAFKDEVCNCCERRSQSLDAENTAHSLDIDTTTQHIDTDTAVPGKIGQLLAGPKTLLRRLWSRRDSLESCENSSSTDSLHSSDNDDSMPADDEIIEVPKEFQVREFPASSLFSSSSSQSEVRLHSRQCTAHTATSATHSRDDRFYHVFKKGEIEKLVKNYTQDLRVVKCSYKSGHWCTTLHKII